MSIVPRSCSSKISAEPPVRMIIGDNSSGRCHGGAPGWILTNCRGQDPGERESNDSLTLTGKISLSGSYFHFLNVEFLFRPELVSVCGPGCHYELTRVTRVMLSAPTLVTTMTRQWPIRGQSEARQPIRSLSDYQNLRIAIACNQAQCQPMSTQLHLEPGTSRDKPRPASANQRPDECQYDQ